MTTKQRTTKRANAGRKTYRGRSVFVDSTGYARVYCPESPMADSEGKVLLHRLIMADKIGRPLTKKEIVHHLDGNILNNKYTNLALCEDNADHVRRYHSGPRGANRSKTPDRLPIVDNADDIKKQYTAILRALRYARRASDITVTELGKAVGMSPAGISNLERGKCHLRISQFIRMTKALGLTPEEVLTAAHEEAK